MKDAYGGILNLVFIVLFLLIVTGILAFTVTYTKAFRMKNFVISSIENYEGRKDCFTGKGASLSCSYDISEKAKKIGYSTDIKCPTGYEKSANKLFCYCPLKKDSNKNEVCDTSGNVFRKNKYRIITQVDIDLPILKNIFGLSFFQVTGDTKYLNGNN